MNEDDASVIQREALAASRGGPPVAVVTIITGDDRTPAGAKMLVRADGSSAGALGDGAREVAIRATAHAALTKRPREVVQTLYVSPDGAVRARRDSVEGDLQVMVEVFETPATLLVVGGGHIGLSLATIGAHAGFHVTVLDDREDYANPDRFPMADHVVCGDLAVELDRMPIDGTTYVVMVTRGHKQDELGLRHVVGSPAAYVGMIGSRRRVAAVLQHLREDGVPEGQLARVHAPIGLDIGAETPEEIAVSIIAEVIAVRRGGPGGPMARREGRPGARPA